MTRTAAGSSAPPHRGGRALRAAAWVLVAGLPLLVLPAAPAAAHASLVGTDPADGAVVPQAPARATLTFTEAVRLTGQPITVYDDRGRPVDSTATASGSEVTVDLSGAELTDGTYVVGWRVVSADGHPISGSFSFSVGAPSSTVVPPPPPASSSAAVTGAQGVLHVLTYAGLLVAAGLAAFVVLVLPGRLADGSLRGRLRRLIRAAAALAAVGAVLLVPVASVRAQGLELVDVGRLDVESVTDEVAFAAVLVAGLGLVLVGTLATHAAPWRRWELLGGALLAVLAPALVGHTRAYQPAVLVMAADVVHVAAGAVWLGGLVGLALSLPALSGRNEPAARTLARFSTLAAGLLLAVAATGTILAWRILGSWSAFVETSYGVLLLVKIGIALVVAGVGAWNRFVLLPRVRRASGAERRSSAGLVRRAVTAEAVLLVVLVGVTGFLVNASPRSEPVERATPGPVRDGAPLGDLHVVASLDPGRQGPNTLRVALHGRPLPAEPPVVELRTDGLDLGRVPVSGEAGSWRADVRLPRSGRWEVQVSVRQGRFDNPVTTLDLEVD